MSSHPVNRNPFVCPSCGVNYSSSIDSDSAPCHLHTCDHTLCGACVKKNRRVNDNSGSNKPFFVNCATCNVRNNIQKEPVRSLSLMEIIEECETSAKPIFVNAYIEAAELPSLKCPGCSLTFSSLVEPYHLYCGHAICQKCLEEKKLESSEEHRNARWPYKYKCSKCNFGSLFRNSAAGGVMADVLKWLAAKKEESIQSLPRNQFVCSDCGQNAPCDRGILCTRCTKSDGGTQRVVCGLCFFEAHRKHAAKKFLPSKLQSMKDDFLLNIQSKIAKCNLDANRVVDEHKTLMGRVEERFSSAVNTIPLAKKCSDGMQISLELKEKADEYEGIMEGIVPSVRKSNKLLEEIISKLAETFPDLAIADGESEKKEETADGESEAKRPRLEESGKEAEKRGETEKP